MRIAFDGVAPVVSDDDGDDDALRSSVSCWCKRVMSVPMLGDGASVRRSECKRTLLALSCVVVSSNTLSTCAISSSSASRSSSYCALSELVCVASEHVHQSIGCQSTRRIDCSHLLRLGDRLLRLLQERDLLLQLCDLVAQTLLGDSAPVLRALLLDRPRVVGFALELRFELRELALEVADLARVLLERLLCVSWVAKSHVSECAIV